MPTTQQPTVALASVASVASVASASLLWYLYNKKASPKAAPKASYTLHLYDHCPFCIRVELYLLLKNIPYKRIVYGYGEGASLAKKGYNEFGGPVALMGKKELPVLEVADDDVDDDGTAMMCESLEILSYLQSKHGGLPCQASPSSLVSWKKLYDDVKRQLVRPRITKLTHLKDWSDVRDVEYATLKYTNCGFDYSNADKYSDKFKSRMNEILLDLDSRILNGVSSEGLPVIMSHGAFSMDDILLLPDLRSLTCVKGVVWPERVRRYVEGWCAGQFGEYFHVAVE